MTIQSRAALALILAVAGAADASLITNDPYVAGAGRVYYQTSPATRYVTPAITYDMYLDFSMSGAPINAPPGTSTHTVQVQASLSGTQGPSSPPPPPPPPPPRPSDPVMDGVVILYYSGSGALFNTEMTSLDLMGGTAPPGMMIRESPTLQSLGQTQITDIGGGLYRIDSFFDVFTELSIDGGQTWLPASNGPSHIEIMPSPGTAVVFSLGALLSTRRRR